MIPRNLRQTRAAKAQKSRSRVVSLPAPVRGWNARDSLADMKPDDAVELVNMFPQTTDVIMRYGTRLWNNLAGAGAANALLIDGVTGTASTPDSATISVSGDIDLRAYAALDDWTTSNPQFFLSKNESYQFFILEGRLGALIYSTAGATAAFLADSTATVPATDGVGLWVRVTVDIDNGAGFSVATFYYSPNGSTWTQLGGVVYQLSLATIKDSTQTLALGSGDYPASVSYYPPPVTCDAADFDGTNDYMTRGAELTGLVDGKSGILSYWVRLDGGNATRLNVLMNGIYTTCRFRSERLPNNLLDNLLVDTSGNNVVSADSSPTTYTSSTTWLHILSSWDVSVSAYTLYVNDVSVLRLNNLANRTIDYTLGNWSVGADTAGSNKMNGALAELYFAPNQYIDFSVEANRRKFITSTGKPAYIGTDGSLPTGTAPIIYLHLDDAEAVANFALNAGTGGNFTITGTLTTASTSPSD